MRRRRRNSGKLLQFPLREFSVEAFPARARIRDKVELVGAENLRHLPAGDWWLTLRVNGRDVGDVVRDPKTGTPVLFAERKQATAWWKSHGQAFTDAMGRAACVRTRKANPADLFHHTTAEKAARVFAEQRLRSAGEPDVYVTTADYDIGYGKVAVPIYVPAKMLQLDDEFPDGRKDYSIKLSRPGGSVAVYAGKPFVVRKANGGTFHKPGPAGGGGRNDADFERDFRREARELAGDPSLRTGAMKRHMRNIAKRPGRGLRRGNKRSAREWVEFAGYAPNHVEEIDGVALKGDYPGVRIDVLEIRGAKTGRVGKIDARQKEVWLVWFNAGERFALTGGPSSMRELAQDFKDLGEPVYLTKVDYVAPRYPVPVGVKRSRANRDMSIAYTHDVENPTLLTWNGQLDPRRAKFDIRVQGKRRRWVNRSGLTF